MGFVGANVRFFLLSPHSLSAATSLPGPASSVSWRTTVPMEGPTAVASTVPAQTTSKHRRVLLPRLQWGKSVRRDDFFGWTCYLVVKTQKSVLAFFYLQRNSCLKT